MNDEKFNGVFYKSAISACVVASFIFGVWSSSHDGECRQPALVAGLFGAAFTAIVACMVSHFQSEDLATQERVAEKERGIALAEKVVGCPAMSFRRPLTREWWEENADDTLAIRIPTRHGIGEYEIEPTTKGREGVDLTVWDSDWNKRFAPDGSLADSGWRPFVVVNLPTVTTVGQLSLLRRALECVDVVVGGDEELESSQ